MPLVRVGARRQVTIPKEIIEQLGIKPGDYVEVTHRDHQVIIVPAEDAWFWSREWQEKEREADEEIKAGRVKRFKNVEELIKDLNS
ncbi:AbrB/MazE/SpoVT family DNA-binding domain-containing protein [Candidatus Acetothermia bacterium]|jgi:AbrB family looped-hinge helix DNA binding protein|nr:AbrB/MazE/SpoVT family DNA-binding domain-containing protein [Candidatus Acetothermia bacterium]MCI2431340.1 AbrB/MazE/SpoVT family DNA-binding domain-containing protein [Candidatus Acetothermia bacterium]MCI2436994.1 AbrB/MazE/SpoVT family DNA-binding domain-containing protein [Candidatus Acetothermia bacterium]